MHQNTTTQKVGILGAFVKLRKSTISFFMFVRPSVRLSALPSAWKNSAPTGRIFMKFDIWVYLEKYVRKFNFHLYLTRITGILREHQCTFMVVCRSVLLRMTNVSDESCKYNHNTYFIFSNVFFESRSLIRYCGKTYCRAWQVTVHVGCTLDTYGYKHILRRGNNYCFSAITMVAQTPLNNR